MRFWWMRLSSARMESGRTSSAYAETETVLWLMIWTIAERQSFQAECFLEEKRGNSYSAYEECKISFIQVTDALR